MRTISLILVVCCLGLSGCFHQKTQVANVKLMEISGDADGQQYTASKTDGFHADNFSGKIPLGQGPGGVFSYELYYHLSIGNGLGTVCTSADFTLRGLVMEKENGELIGIRFLKELTGKLNYDKEKLTISNLSKSPSFGNLTIGDLKAVEIPSIKAGFSGGLSEWKYNSLLSVQFLPNTADQTNRFELLFDIVLQKGLITANPSLSAN